MPRRTTRTIVHSDLMRWEPLAVRGGEGYAWIKTLSKDPETGARSALIKYDPGFRAPAAVAEWPVDMYVLEGEMVAGDRRYEPHTFHYRPAGSTIGPVHTATGITRIVFTADSRDPARSSSDEAFIQSVERDLPWDPPPAGGSATGGQPGALYAERKTSGDALMEEPRLRRNKTLRLDPIANIRMRTYSVKRGGLRNMMGEMHVHGFGEETFLIRGGNYEYVDEVDGHMRWMAGSYLCRAPGECLHGDTLKLEDDHYSITRSGWTSDSALAAAWKAIETKSTVPLRPLSFAE